MAYKIAVASSDGKQIDETFGSAGSFIIYEVADGTYQKLEERFFAPSQEGVSPSAAGTGTGAAGIGNGAGCGTGTGGIGCGGGAGCGTGGGCSGQEGASAKVRLISDCRCIVCKKIGFHIQKQLERLAISSFDVDCSVEEALTKITAYLQRVDGHQTLRGLSEKNG